MTLTPMAAPLLGSAVGVGWTLTEALAASAVALSATATGEFVGVVARLEGGCGLRSGRCCCPGRFDGVADGGDFAATVPAKRHLR